MKKLTTGQSGETSSPAPSVMEIELKPGPDGATMVQLSHPDEALAKSALDAALGVQTEHFLEPFIAQMCNAAQRDGEVDYRGANFMLSVVRGLEPRDQLEAMMAVQMAAIHSHVMRAARNLASADNTIQQDSAQNMLTKLARTFASQLEALKRYRSGGEQRVTVEHVTVNAGGQAIVGSVSAGEGAKAMRRLASALMRDAKRITDL